MDGPGESAREYRRMKTHIEKLIEESSRLAGHHKEMMQHNVVLSNLCHNFNEVQGRLERVAAVKPGCTLLNH